MGKKKKRQKALNQKKTNHQKPQKQIRIMVGMPIHHYIDTFTQMCLDATVSYLLQRGIIFDRVSTVGIPDVGKARNDIVEMFLEEKQYTHLMWIDSDMAWNPTAVEALINLQVPVASCLVTKKSPPFNITLFTLLRPDEKTQSLDTFTVPFGNYPLDKPFRFPNSGIGTAFMLIERQVIEKMEKPYFGGMADPVTRTLKGTDFYFCVQILRHGYEFVYDPRPNVYHVGKCLFGVEDHIAFLDQWQKEGIRECQFMSIDAPSVEQWKASFAGPHPDLKLQVASVEQQQRRYSPHQQSIEEYYADPLLEKDDQMKAGMSAGSDPVKWRRESAPTKPPPPQVKKPTKSMSVDGPERKVGHDERNDEKGSPGDQNIPARR